MNQHPLLGQGEDLTSDLHRGLEQLVLLLDRAGRQAWDDAERAEDRLGLHSLAVAIFLALAQAAAHLPEGHELSGESLGDYLLPVAGDAEHLPDPLNLLVAAEEQSNSLLRNSQLLPTLSPLAIAVSDLIRQARGVGY